MRRRRLSDDEVILWVGSSVGSVVDINEVRLVELTEMISEWQDLLVAEAVVGSPSEAGNDELSPYVAFALGNVHRMLGFALEAANGDEDALTRLRRVRWRLRGLVRECQRRAHPGTHRTRPAAAEAMAYRRCVRELRERML